MKNKIIYLPYLLKNIKTDVNGETVWHSNKFLNICLKIKRFFFKSKNIKEFEKFKNIKINTKYNGSNNK